MMKKFMFFALASAAMLASCSSDDTVAVDESNVAQLQDGPAAIQIGMGGVAYTRGTGTVGGTLSEGNKWAGEKFNLFMLKKGTVELATKNNLDTESTADAIYNNYLFTAPAAVDSGKAKAYDESVKYYPATGNYDFWAYRLDSANIVKGATSVDTLKPVIGANDIKIDFKINGSQDILVGKAINDDPLAYSARAARKGIQPVITFKHLLTRLKFTVAPGNEVTANGTYAVVIDSIGAESKTDGTLTVAAVGDTDGSAQQITFDDATDTLYVMQRTAANTEMTTLASVDLAGKWDSSAPVQDVANAATFVPVGEALLVAPNTEMKLIVKGHQTVSTGTGVETRYFKLPLTAEHAGGFVAGTSYNVKIVVYGLEEIIVNVELTPWENVDLDPIGQDL